MMWQHLLVLFCVCLGLFRFESVDAEEHIPDDSVEPMQEIPASDSQDSTPTSHQCINQVEVDACADKEFKNFPVTFRNEYDRILSLYWLNDESYPELIELAVNAHAEIKLRSWTGHRFLFTRPGSLAMVGSTFVMNNCQSEYVLPSDAVDNSVLGGCFDSIPAYCEMQKDNCLITPGYLIANCPKTCNMCDLIDINTRCTRSRLNISEEPWLKPGDLNKMFEGIVERGKDFEPNVVSLPPDGPWVVVFDKFVRDEEVEALIKWGNHYSFERSTDVGPMFSRGGQEKIVSSHRTSANCWCFRECKNDPILEPLYKRVEDLVLTPRSHYEDFQLLKYLPGQYYRVHHDMYPHPHHKELGAGPRTLTVFLYLSDVEEGGETGFPKLNISVEPKKGRMLIWPSVLDEDPFAQDERTFHEAKTVIKGLKYGSNLWVHTHNFQVSNLWEC